MCGSNSFSQIANLDLGIEDGGLDRGVSEEFLEVADVGASLKKVRRAGSPERVRVHGFSDSRDFRVAPYGDLEKTRARPPAPSPKEEGRLSRVMDEGRPSPFEISSYDFGGFSRDGNEPVLLSLSVSHQKRSPVKVDVAQVQPQALPSANRRPIEDLEHRPVPKTRHRVWGRGFEKFLDLRLGEQDLRKTRHPRAMEAPGGVPKDDASPVEKGEEPLHSIEVRALGRKRERLPVPGRLLSKLREKGDEVPLRHLLDVGEAFFP